MVGEPRAKEEDGGGDSGSGGGTGGQIVNAHYLCELYPFPREVLHTYADTYDR